MALVWKHWYVSLAWAAVQIQPLFSSPEKCVPLLFIYFSKHGAFIFTAYLNPGLIEGGWKEAGGPSRERWAHPGNVPVQCTRSWHRREKLSHLLSQHAVIKKAQGAINTASLSFGAKLANSLLSFQSRRQVSGGSRGGVPRHSAIKENCQENIITSLPAPVGFELRRLWPLGRLSEL